MGRPQTFGKFLNVSYNALPQDNSGPFLAIVVGHQDSRYMGRIAVKLLRPTDNSLVDGSIRVVSPLMPFAGRTSLTPNSGNDNSYDSTQKSYGMWMLPPDPGTRVMVWFINGDPKYGYYMGCLLDEGMNFMMPGVAATTTNAESTSDRLPVAEYNRGYYGQKGEGNDSEDQNFANDTDIPKPVHPFAKVLKAQGLDHDDIRGITTSSARREAPSMVFGISTPGPVDNQANAPTVTFDDGSGNVDGVPSSRLGGTTFVMDDGDPAFLRKGPASTTAPDYAAILQGDDLPSDPTIPHNELVRIRTRTGHQILLHNSEDLIYIGNAKGTAWIELTSNGKIDIYSSDSISIHSSNDFNFYADRDVNIEAGRNINVKAAGKQQTEIGADSSTIIGGDSTITITGSVNQTVAANFFSTVTGNANFSTAGQNSFSSGQGTNILSAGNLAITGAPINLNGPVPATAAIPATPAIALSVHQVAISASATMTSIMQRIPQKEPYINHENYDPNLVTPVLTDRDATADIKPPTWKASPYTTSLDTFVTPPPPADDTGT